MTGLFPEIIPLSSLAADFAAFPQLKRAGLTYAALAERLKEHGLTDETEASIKAKLKRGTFSATFLLACVAAIGLEAVELGDL